MSTIVAVGSLAFDSIETPFGHVEQALGGSANYFSLGASYFTKVQCISVVGEDFPDSHLQTLKDRGVDTRGIQRARGKTFHWAGRYGYDLHDAQTLNTCLNVFEHFNPEVPEEFRDSEFVFLGNVAPQLQLKVLGQIRRPKCVALDSMNFWISGQREALIEAIRRVDVVIINDGEARQLTQTHNIVEAARNVLAWGPKVLVVKRGEYGALLFDRGEMFSLPGLPLAEVKDPTGAGDSFAGGFLGYLASEEDTGNAALRRAVVYGCVVASFTVQDFGFASLMSQSRGAIEERYRKFVELTRFHV